MLLTNLKFIDADKKEILFVDELSLDYDFLIMAPGIGYQKKQIQGYSIEDSENIYLIVGTVKIKYLTLKKLRFS